MRRTGVPEVKDEYSKACEQFQLVGGRYYVTTKEVFIGNIRYE